MSYRYEDFMWKIIYKALSKEKHLDIVIDKDKHNAESIDERVVENILKEKYMNGSHLDILKSMFNMILLHHVEDPSGKEDFNLPYLDISILNLLNSFKLASLKDTSEGYAMLSNFKSINDMVIVKTSKTKNDNKGILFEYFISTFGINKLRSLIPNFAYTLAIFKCNPLPINTVDKKIDIDRFCKEETQDSRFYVVYEKIKGISINDFVNDMMDDNDAHKIQTYIIQIAFTLIIAQREIGFVHYDLHTDNIILRKLPSPQVIEYKIDGRTYRVETDAIPTIIDYGFSHFVYEGIPVGGKTMPELGIIPTLTSKGFDLYKLVMYIMNRSFKKRGINFFNKISWIMDYFNGDPFGIHRAYKSGNSENLNYAFGVGWKKFYNVTQTSPIFHDPPMNFLKWISRVNKPFWDKSVKVSYSLYDIPSNTIIESYRAKIEGRRIFNSEVKDNLDDCEILENDHKSYIINKYVSDEFKKILDNFGVYIKDPHTLKKKIKSLDDKSERNKKTYHQNDLSLLSLYTDELVSVQGFILLDEYEKKLNMVRSIIDIKRLDATMKILKSYIEIYSNYRIFIGYSRISSQFTTDLSIDEYQERAISLYKKYEGLKSEYIFESLRKQLDIINSIVCFNNKYNSPIYWNVSTTFINSLTTIQYVVDDIRLFYPEIEYAYAYIETFIYRVVLDMSRILSKHIYVPPRSGIQFQIATKCSRDEISYIMNKNFKPINRDKSIDEFINGISNGNIKSDTEIYNEISTRFIRSKRSPDLNKDLEFIKDNERYRNMKMEAKIKYLDTGSPVMKKFSRDILDILGIPESDLVTINLSGNGDQNFINLVDINSSGNSPFPPNTFSLISAFMVLHNIDDIADRLSELYRLLKRGGLLITREYDSGTLCQKIISDIDGIITSEETSKATRSYNESSVVWKSIMYTSGFKFVAEQADTSFTTYSIYTK